MPLSAADYRPRDAEHAVLFPVIAEHLEAFLETARRHDDLSRRRMPVGWRLSDAIIQWHPPMTMSENR